MAIISDAFKMSSGRLSEFFLKMIFTNTAPLSPRFHKAAQA